jgi:quercetin dioxygenase-like cupin family protein
LRNPHLLRKTRTTAQVSLPSKSIWSKQEYLKAVPGVPDKVVRMTILEIPPDGVVDPHCHHGYEYGIVTQGTLMVKSGGGDYESKEHYSPRSGKFPAHSTALLPRLESAG